MNAMIRGVKGTLAVLALVGVGLGLRWMTAGSITGVNSHDLDSMTFLAVGTVAWMAYGWLVLAVLVTVLEQLPGAIGALAGAIAGRITSTTARTLLRSSLGVAAVTPLTVGVAHATPADATTRPGTQVEPHSSVQLTNTPTWRTAEPGSTVHLTGPAPAAHPDAAPSGTTDWRATEPPSTVRLTEQAPTTGSAQSSARTGAPNPQTTPAPWPPTSNGTHPETGVRTPPPNAAQSDAARPQASRPTTGVPADGVHTPDGKATRQPAPTQPHASRPDVRRPGTTQAGTTRPGVDRPGVDRPGVDRPGVDRPGVDQRGTTEPGTTRRGVDRPGVDRSGVGRVQDGVPGGGRVRVGVPDRPAVGAATRYTDLRSGVPVRVPGRVVVRAGDSLWSIAARELGPNASAEAIGARWPEWYAANRQVIGSDPDLILPGQVLRIPAAATGQHVPPTHQEK
jgi:nucleoid-associated protein YgaU